MLINKVEKSLHLLLVNERTSRLDMSCLVSKPYAVAASNESRFRLWDEEGRA